MDALPSFGWQQHSRGDTGWDHSRCERCGWVHPDTGHRRGTAARYDEWFPSMDAFAHFKKTGVRSWIGGSACDASADTHPQGGDSEAAPFMSGAVPKADAKTSMESKS